LGPSASGAKNDRQLKTIDSKFSPLIIAVNSILDDQTDFARSKCCKTFLRPIHLPSDLVALIYGFLLVKPLKLAYDRVVTFA
nr:hypothetical protein [Bifidobacterium bifidum]